MTYKKILPVIAFLFIILSLGFLSATTWEQYGGNVNPSSNTLTRDFKGNFLNNSVSLSIYNTTNGYPINSGSFQPLTFKPNNLSNELNILITEGSYIYIYDKTFTLLSTAYVGAGMSIKSMGDISVNPTNKFSAIYTNGSQNTFFLYDISSTSQLSFNQSLNLSINQVNNSGVRHSGTTYYFLEQNSFNASHNTYLFNKVNLTNGLLTNHSLTLGNYIKGGNEPLTLSTNAINDGRDFYLYWDSEKAIVFDNLGSIVYQYDPNALYTIHDAKLYIHDTTGFYALAVLEFGNVAPNRAFLKSIKLENLQTKFNNTVAQQSTGWLTKAGSMAIVRDFNRVSKNSDDILIYYQLTDGGSVGGIYYYVYNGDTGATLKSKSFNPGVALSNKASLTSADMNGDGYYDFIVSHQRSQNGLSVYDVVNQTEIYFNNALFTSTLNPSCIPTDFNGDSKLDVLCSSDSSTLFLGIDYTNQNPTISTVILDPSSVLQAGSTLNFLINAVDIESDPIIYSHTCFNGDTPSEDLNYNRTCTYNTIGTYNLSVFVRDGFHSEKNSFTTIITVTSTGTVTCNNNGVCESGESLTTCPNDCDTVYNSSNSVSVSGGLILPLEIVSTTDKNAGFLPELWKGTIVFLSYTLYPIVVIIFLFLFMLIFIAIFSFIKKFAQKLGG